jgi:sugar phosphate isomerase/epimerase
MDPRPPKSYKGVFPFRLATTSFIYPDDYLPNVRRLAPYLDEIELLFLEGATPGALPPPAEIDAMAQVGKEQNLRFNIHLPTDVSISDSDPGRQKAAVDAIIGTLKRTAPLRPTTCTLHIDYREAGLSEATLKRWENRVRRNLDRLLGNGIDAGKISIETLDYPFHLLDRILADYGLSVCLDLGHLAIHGYDLKEMFGRYGPQTAIIHLHGVKNRRDHLALDPDAVEFMAAVIDLLEAYDGVVSLEVFSYDNLAASLECLDTWWRMDRPPLAGLEGGT